MNFSLGTWIGEVTTGHGAMILGPTLLAASSGTMSWPTAVPLLAAGVIGLLWPENTALERAAMTTAIDIEALIVAYRTGLSHGAVGDAPDAIAAPPVSQPHGGAAASALAMLVAAGLTLTACANPTPAQQAAAETTIASGLLCLADASGRIVATASTNDPNSLKAVNAAIAAGNVLLTDAACQIAFARGAVAMPAGGTTKP
ncbi:MAG TPA: hypothetical protein VND19_24860 [Acetobacteraceae bacterium]|nr:hypothetical protein [Acetobacteraceae bacterium]